MGVFVRVLTVATVLFSPVLAAGQVAFPAQAQPGTPFSADIPGGGPGVTLEWRKLGLPRSVDFAAANVPQVFNVPIPTGLNAVRLRGQIQGMVNLGAGYLEIDDGQGTFLAAVNLPAPTAIPAAIPFDVDIAAAQRLTSSISLSFTVRQLDTNGQFCGPVQQLTMSNLAVDFAGDIAPPTTISTFFPSVLEAVTIYAPNDADPAEQQSVLTLVSTLVRIYQPQPVEVVVENQLRGASPPPVSPMSRVVVVERGSPGLSLANADGSGTYLRVSGIGDQLTGQVSLLASQLQSLAQVPSARIDQPGADAALSGDTLTFSQLKMNGKVDVLRNATLTIGVDRAAFGTSRVASARVRLLASYTPVAKEDAATVVVRANELVVYKAALDASGSVDATFDLPSQALAERITLNFALTYTPRQPCGPLIAPIVFEVDPRSTMTVQRGGPPGAGFRAFPSEFSPDFVVALDGSSPNQLGYAAAVTKDIARLTTVSLQPRVVDLKSAADATSGALIVANAAAINQTSLNPPVRGGGTAIDVDLPTELRANIDNGLGSIQAFADPPRDRSVVLVTTTGAWTLVEPLFGYVNGLGDGWSELSGDVLAAGAAGTPTDLAIRSGGDTFEAVPLRSFNPWILVGVGVAVIAAVAVIVATLWSRRRRAPAGGSDAG